MNDFEKLLKSTFPFVEELLIKNREFYPVCCAMNIENEICMIGIFDDNEKPLSTKVIEDLKKNLKIKKDNYNSLLIFYDDMVNDDETNKKTDAVAVFAESKFEEKAFMFYYPYQWNNVNQLTWLASWKEETVKEVF